MSTTPHRRSPRRSFGNFTTFWRDWLKLDAAPVPRGNLTSNGEFWQEENKFGKLFFWSIVIEILLTAFICVLALAVVEDAHTDHRCSFFLQVACRNHCIALKATVKAGLTVSSEWVFLCAGWVFEERWTSLTGESFDDVISSMSIKLFFNHSVYVFSENDFFRLDFPMFLSFFQTVFCAFYLLFFTFKWRKVVVWMELHACFYVQIEF